MTSELDNPRNLSAGFGIKIMIIVSVILLVSQSLGTFLSVITFEKIFVGAITSKYEILGKEVQRKIEKALKFGKSINKFVGMDKLVEPLYKISDDLSEVFLSDISGKILYTSGRAECIVGKNFSDTINPAGKVLYSKFNAPGTFPSDILFDQDATDTIIRLYQEKHYILFPIIPKYGGGKAILGLVFNQSVVDSKKAAMFKNAMNKLCGITLVSVVMIGFLIHFFFLKPVQNQVEFLILKSSVDTEEKDDCGKSLKLPQEIEEIQVSINEYKNRISTTRIELLTALDTLDEITDSDSETSLEIERMKSIATGKEEPNE